MNMTAILIAAAVIAVAGLIVGIGLGLFGEKFNPFIWRESCIKLLAENEWNRNNDKRVIQRA